MLLGDNLPLLKQIKSETVSLIYIDPPFNTGKKQSAHELKPHALMVAKVTVRDFAVIVIILRLSENLATPTLLMILLAFYNRACKKRIAF